LDIVKTVQTNGNKRETKSSVKMAKTNTISRGICHLHH